MIWFNNWASLSLFDRVCYMMLYIVTHRGEGRWKSPSGQKENLNCSVLVSNLKTYLNFTPFLKRCVDRPALHLAEMNLSGVQCWPTLDSAAKVKNHIWSYSKKLFKGCW